jgi:phage FluMu protein Com
MSQPRKCPHCQYILPASSGYTFDHELNMRCSKCGKVVFPATPAAETELLQRPHQPVYQPQHWVDADTEDQY